MKKILSLIFLLSIVLESAAGDFRLLNGMTGTWQSAPGTGMVGVVALVGAGVRNETPATNGLSHYLEHMLFNGTRSLSQEQLYAAFDRFGIYSNAQTGKNYIAFMMVGRSTDIDTILGLLREQLFYSSLPEDKFAKEKGIVLQEMSKDELDENYRFTTLFDLWDKAETPYALPTLGSSISIESIRREQVIEYYKTWFHPNNVRLMVAGDIEYNDLVKSVRKELETVVAGDMPKQTKWNRLPIDRDQLETVPTSGPSNRFKASIGLPSLDSTAFQAALELATNLFEADRYLENTGYSDVSISIFRDRDFTQLEIAGSCDQTVSIEGLRSALKTAVGQWRKNDLTATALRSERMQARIEADKSGERLQYWGLLRAPKAAVAPDRVWEEIAAKKSALTVREVGNVLEQVLSKPYRLFAEAPMSHNLEGRIDSIRIVDRSLENGVRIVSRQSSGSKLVGGHIAFANRSLREPDSLHGIAELAHRMLSDGPATLTSNQWRDTLAAIGLDLKFADDPNIPYDDYYTSSAFSFIRFDVPSENFELAMKLIYQTVTHPRWDSTSFANQKSAAQQRAGREAGTPRRLAQTELDKQLYPDQPSVSPYGIPKQVAAIGIPELQQFAASYWVGNATILTLDGPIAPDSLNRIAESVWKQLPPGKKVSKPVRKQQALTGNINVKAGKSQSQVLIGSMRQNPPSGLSDAASIAIDIFSTRLQQDLRETRGWAYSVGAGFRSLSDAWLVTMSIGTKKNLLDSAATAMQEDYRKFLAGTVDSSEVLRTKSAIAGRLRMREASRQYRAYALGMAALQDADPRKALPGYNSIDNVTVDEIRRSISELPRECIIIEVE